MDCLLRFDRMLRKREHIDETLKKDNFFHSDSEEKLCYKKVRFLTSSLVEKMRTPSSTSIVKRSNLFITQHRHVVEKAS